MVDVRRRALVAVAAALLVAGWGSAATALDEPRAPSAASSTAGITVDFGNGHIVRRTVSFTASSISGLDALRRAGFVVDLYGFSGIGAAVCRIDGVGRPADAGCLSGGNDYWGYWRNGTYSRVGAGSTAVHDHDQEQWKWGTGGSAPPTTAFPPPATQPPATTRPATTRPATTGPAGTGPTGTTSTPPCGGAGTTAPGPVATSVAGGSATTTSGAASTAPGGVTTTTHPGRPTPTSGGGGASTTPRRGSGDGGGEVASGAASPVSASEPGGTGPPWGLAAFAAVLAVVIGLTVRARRARAER